MATLSLGVHVFGGSLDGIQSKESRKKEGGRSEEREEDAEDEEGENLRAAVLHVWVGLFG